MANEQDDRANPAVPSSLSSDPTPVDPLAATHNGQFVAGRWGYGFGAVLGVLALIAGWCVPASSGGVTVVSPPAFVANTLTGWLIPSPTALQVAIANPTTMPISKPPISKPTMSPTALVTPIRILEVVRVVRAGDTLSEIADEYDVSMDAIMEVNKLAERTACPSGCG